MRKVKLEITAKVPSWHFCNLDKATGKLSVSKELCRFCHQTKTGYRCSLYDKWLTADRGLVDKTPQCIHDTIERSATIVEEDVPAMPQVDPKLIIRESLKAYIKTVNSLVAQGYPQSLAETIAEKYTLGEES